LLWPPHSNSHSNGYSNTHNNTVFVTLSNQWEDSVHAHHPLRPAQGGPAVIGLGSARIPAYDHRSVPLELAAAGYEANGADTDFMTAWLPSRLPLKAMEWMRNYRAAAENVFNDQCDTFNRTETEWTADPRGARWTAEVVYEPADGETDSGVWFSRAMFEPDPDDIHASGHVLPGLPPEAILEVTVRMAPGHPDYRPDKSE
jgi:hypothetical protein